MRPHRGQKAAQDWRRDTTRYGQCANVFLPATVLAAIVIYWL